MKRRTRKSNNTHSQKEINYSARAEYARKFISFSFNNRTHFTPTQKAAITRAWKHYNNYRETHHIVIKNKTVRNRLKAAGFVVTEKGAFIDKPRTADGNIIRGARLRVLKSGIVTESFKDRRTHTIGIPAKDRKRFAADPCEYLAGLEKRYRDKLNKPGAAVALMWGAHQAARTQFQTGAKLCNAIHNYLHDENGKVNHKVNKLSGLRIIEHVEKPKKKRKKTKKRKARKTARHT